MLVNGAWHEGQFANRKLLGEMEGMYLHAHKHTHTHTHTHTYIQITIAIVLCFFEQNLKVKVHLMVSSDGIDLGQFVESELNVEKRIARIGGGSSYVVNVIVRVCVCTSAVSMSFERTLTLTYHRQNRTFIYLYIIYIYTHTHMSN